MKFKLIPLLALASGITLATAACSGDKNNAAGSGTDATASDTASPAATDSTAANSQASDFLTAALQGDNSEVKLGNLAKDNASSQGVKDFGKMLADDHGKAKDQVKKIADGLNLSLHDSTTPEAEAEYTKLQGLKGKDFDKEFVSYMVDDHKKDIDDFQKEADSSDPAQVTDLAKQTLPKLKKHLDTAESLQKKL